MHTLYMRHFERLSTHHVILNVVKNLSVCTNAERLASLEILRSAQDDNVKYKHTLYVILNAVKNLAVCTYPERLSNLEILRFAQDDRINIVIAKNCITGRADTTDALCNSVAIYLCL